MTTLNSYERVSQVVAELPLRRDYKDIPQTPKDMNFTKFPPTVEAILALLPSELATAFKQEITTTPIQHLTDLAMDWGMAAVSLHNPDVQDSLERIADGDVNGLRAKMSPPLSWYEKNPTEKEDNRG